MWNQPHLKTKSHSLYLKIKGLFIPQELDFTTGGSEFESIPKQNYLTDRIRNALKEGTEIK